MFNSRFYKKNKKHAEKLLRKYSRSDSLAKIVLEIFETAFNRRPSKDLSWIEAVKQQSFKNLIWNPIIFPVLHSIAHNKDSQVGICPGWYTQIDLCATKAIESIIPVSFSFILHGKPGVGKSFAATLLRDSGFEVQHLTTLRPYGEEILSPTTEHIYIIDEVDRLFDGPKAVRDLILFLDMCRFEGGIVVIMTTNNIDDIPIEVKRPGRVTDIIEVPMWTAKEAKEYCQNLGIPFKDAPSEDNGLYLPGRLMEWVQQVITKEILSSTLKK